MSKLGSERLCNHVGGATIAFTQSDRPDAPELAMPMATFHTRGSGGLSVAAGRGEQPHGRPAVALLSLSEAVS